MSLFGWTKTNDDDILREAEEQDSGRSITCPRCGGVSVCTCLPDPIPNDSADADSDDTGLGVC